MNRVLTHARHNAVGYVALFLALGGTSYAATSLAANSVGTTQLKSNAVTGAKIKAGTIQASDLAKSAKTAGATGPAGPAGATGPAGPAGPAGAAATNLFAVVSASGQLIQGSGVTAVSHQNGSANYIVIFNRNVSRCALVGAVGGYVNGGNSAGPADGTANAGVVGDTGDTQVATVNVITRAGSGATADRAFHLIVSC